VDDGWWTMAGETLEGAVITNTARCIDEREIKHQLTSLQSLFGFQT
jgi:hypothetical protein